MLYIAAAIVAMTTVLFMTSLMRYWSTAYY